MDFLKETKVRSQALRDSAKGEQCTANTPVCNYNRETTVLCHFNTGGKGMGSKDSDLSAGYCCNSCHDLLDSRTGILSQEDKYFYMMRSIVRTLHRMFEKGLITIKGAK
jgi:hypothetical protein